MAGDERKLEFTYQALRSADPFAAAVAVDEDVRRSIDMLASWSAGEVIAYRERVTSRIEREAKKLWETGQCAAWMQGAQCVSC